MSKFLIPLIRYLCYPPVSILDKGENTGQGPSLSLLPSLVTLAPLFPLFWSFWYFDDLTSSECAHREQLWCFTPLFWSVLKKLLFRAWDNARTSCCVFSWHLALLQKYSFTIKFIVNDYSTEYRNSLWDIALYLALGRSYNLVGRRIMEKRCLFGHGNMPIKKVSR